jgi:hypothetical protein
MDFSETKEIIENLRTRYMSELIRLGSLERKGLMDSKWDAKLKLQGKFEALENILSEIRKAEMTRKGSY